MRARSSRAPWRAGHEIAGRGLAMQPEGACHGARRQGADRAHLTARCTRDLGPFKHDAALGVPPWVWPWA